MARRRYTVIGISTTSDGDCHPETIVEGEGLKGSSTVYNRLVCWAEVVRTCCTKKSHEQAEYFRIVSATGTRLILERILR
jgi:hypothetical protein